MGVMDIPDAVIDSETAKILTAAELAKVLAIMRSHRRTLICDLSSGAAAIVNGIIRDARLRGPRERKPQAPEVATIRAAREKARQEIAQAMDPHHAWQPEHKPMSADKWLDKQRTH